MKEKSNAEGSNTGQDGGEGRCGQVEGGSKRDIPAEGTKEQNEIEVEKNEEKQKAQQTENVTEQQEEETKGEKQMTGEQGPEKTATRETEESALNLRGTAGLYATFASAYSHVCTLTLSSASGSVASTHKDTST